MYIWLRNRRRTGDKSQENATWRDPMTAYHAQAVPLVPVLCTLLTAQEALAPRSMTVIGAVGRSLG